MSFSVNAYRPFEPVLIPVLADLAQGLVPNVTLCFCPQPQSRWACAWLDAGSLPPDRPQIDFNINWMIYYRNSLCSRLSLGEMRADLLHEIGHVKTNVLAIGKASREYAAHQWAMNYAATHQRRYELFDLRWRIANWNRSEDRSLRIAHRMSKAAGISWD